MITKIITLSGDVYYAHDREERDPKAPLVVPEDIEEAPPIPAWILGLPFMRKPRREK